MADGGIVISLRLRPTEDSALGRKRSFCAVPSAVCERTERKVLRRDEYRSDDTDRGERLGSLDDCSENSAFSQSVCERNVRVGDRIGFVRDPFQPESRTLRFFTRDQWQLIAGDGPAPQTNDWVRTQASRTRPATMTERWLHRRDTSMHGPCPSRTILQLVDWAEVTGILVHAILETLGSEGCRSELSLGRRRVYQRFPSLQAPRWSHKKDRSPVTPNSKTPSTTGEDLSNWTKSRRQRFRQRKLNQ